jgi:Tfp pilus assembly protein PilO
MKRTAWRHGNWLTTISMAGTTALFMAVFFLPQMRAIRAARAEIAEKELMILQEPTLAAQVLAAEKDCEETRTYVARWEEQAPSGRDLGEVFARIAQLAQSSQAAVTRFEPDTAIEYGAIRQLPVSLGCDGTFSGLFGFVAAIEELPQTIWINDLHFRRTGKDEQSLHCDIALGIFADKSEISD